MQITSIPILSQFFATQEKTKAKTPLPNVVLSSPNISNFNWKQRAIQSINTWDARLEEILPNFFLQTKIDSLAKQLELQFAPFHEFNKWLESNGNGNWHQQMATFLAKLPARSARNIVQLLYGTVQTTLYTAVHPLKASLHLAKHMILLIDALEKPEVWALMGAGSLGTAAGQAWILGSPIPLCGIAVAGTIVLGGISIAALRKSLSELQPTLSKLPEAFLTGTLLGALMGCVKKHLSKKDTQELQKPQKLPPKRPRPRKPESKRIYYERIDYLKASGFVKKNDLPAYSNIFLDKEGNIAISWTSAEAFEYFKQRHPGPFNRILRSSDRELYNVKITLTDKVPRMDIAYSALCADYIDNERAMIRQLFSTRDWLSRDYNPWLHEYQMP